ncbi:AIPR family protein [bacterium]|nr:AIPR family protein [bacterium]
MPLSDADFIRQVQEEVDFLFDSYSHEGESKDSAFAQWILQLLFPSIDSDQAFNLLVSDRTWNVDTSYRDEDSGTFYLVQARYSEKPTEVTFGPGLVYGLLDTYKKIQDLDEDQEEEHKVLSEAAKAMKDGYSISFIFNIFGRIDETVDLSDVLTKYALEEQQVELYDFHKLRRLAAGLEEDVKDESVTLPFLTYSSYEIGPVEAIVGSVDAYDFKKAFQDLAPRIYDVNLRVPLGKTKINNQMMKTLDSEQERRFFWYYNNGITVLCKGFQPEENDSEKVVLNSPRIVNGAQTTHTLLSSSLEKAGSVALVVRIIAALPGSTQISSEVRDQSGVLEDLYLNVAKYTNSQNRIEIPDFRSNERVQKSLHEKFKSLGWFYEHRRGQWDTADKNRYGKKRIKMVDLAQKWFAFDGHPATAIREKQSLFEEQGHYGSIFMLSRSAEEYLISHLLFDQIQDRLKENIKRAKEEARIATERGGRIPLGARNYLMIGRATKLATAHMTALLGKALYDRYGALDQGNLANRILALVENTELVNQTYSDLEDTLFRLATQLQGEKYKTMHRMLSESDTLDELYDLFKYVLEREINKGRDPLLIPASEND